MAHPKVFISYSHDSVTHRQSVLEFSERLRADGIDTRIDQYAPSPAEGWPRWMERHIDEADFVLLVCTETYFKRVSGHEEPGVGRGVCWEANLIYNELYERKVETSKFIPIFFDRANSEYLPLPLRGHTHYVVDTNEEYEDLYRILTQQPSVAPGPIGELRKLPSLNPMQKVPESFPPSDVWRDDNNPTVVKKFFISYSHGNHDEENLARFLHSRLTEHGHEAFIDIGMKAGIDWLDEIKYRIAEWCDHFILLLSRESMSSEMVLQEVRMARASSRERGRPHILLVRITYFGPLDYELHSYFSRLQYCKWESHDNSVSVLDYIENAPASEISQPSRKKDFGSAETSDEFSPADISTRPRAATDLRTASAPGGTIRHDDPCYIERAMTKSIMALAPMTGETIVLKAPHQMGKSSLLTRYLAACQEAGKEVAFVDFSIFEEEDLATYPKFLTCIAWALHESLGINLDEEPNIESQRMMGPYLRNKILKAMQGRVVFAFDEMDRIMGRDYQTDFFTMLRSFHNSRANIRSPWQDVDLALVISTEPYLLIRQADRSPFNVVPATELSPFTLAECQELNAKYGHLLKPPQVGELYDLLLGHPYLTRLAYYRIIGPDQYDFNNLIEKADEERGPFGEHLRAKLADLRADTELLQGMRQILDPEDEPGEDLYYRLHGAGLAVRHELGRIDPANLLYARYFKRTL